MTIAAVAGAVGLLVGMFAVAEGLVQATLNDLNRTPVDLAVSGGGAAALRGAHEMAANLTADPRIAVATGELDSRITVRVPGRPRPLSVVAEGIVPADARQVISDSERARLPSYGHSGFTDGGDPHRASGYTGPWTDEILVDHRMAGTFGIVRGGTIHVAASPTGEGRNMTVAGIFDTEGTGEGVLATFYVVILHLSELQSLVGLDVARGPGGSVEVIDAIDTMAVRATVETRTAHGGLAALQKDIEAGYPFASVTSRQDAIENAEESFTVARIFFGLIGGVALAIGLLFVTCVMVMTVSERTNEFGMMRAIGVSKRTVFLGVLTESVLLVAIGAVAGLIPGYGAASLFAGLVESTAGQEVTYLKFTPDVVGPLLGVVLLGGVLVSLFPAVSATSMQPAQAIRRVR